MSHPQPRYSPEEFARRGEAFYQNDIRPQIEAGNKGKIVAIDIESGEYEIAEDTMAAADWLLARRPDAKIWFIRIGYPALHRIGGHPRRRVI
jgi:hypothetical protein